MQALTRPSCGDGTLAPEPPVSGGHLTRYLRTSGTGGVDIVHQLLEDGALGELRTMQAECGEYLTGDHRTMGPELGGGLLRVTLQPQMLGRLSTSL